MFTLPAAASGRIVKVAGNSGIRYREARYMPDGKSILASGDDELALDRLLAAQGHNTSDILIAFVPLPDEVLLGGGGMVE